MTPPDPFASTELQERLEAAYIALRDGSGASQHDAAWAILCLALADLKAMDANLDTDDAIAAARRIIDP